MRPSFKEKEEKSNVRASRLPREEAHVQKNQKSDGIKKNFFGEASLRHVPNNHVIYSLAQTSSKPYASSISPHFGYDN